MRTVIGVVGSTREARLKLMHGLGTKLANEGYKVVLVFNDEHEAVKGSNAFLVAKLMKTSTLMIVGSRLSLDDIGGLIPGKWCLVLAEGRRAAPHIIVAASEADISEVGPESIAVVPLSDEARRLAISWTDKVVDVDEVIKVIRERVVKDVLKVLALKDCGKCGFNSCRGLAEAIAKGEESPIKCVERGEEVRLVVDGELVPLNQFTSKVFTTILRGLLSILKGVPRSAKKVFLEADLY